MKKFLFLPLMLLSACGTIFSGTQQSITVNSNITEAKVYINGMPVCSTPCAVDVKRSQSNVFIMLKKDGYENVTAVLSSQINPVSIINLSSLYSWTTDFLSNGVWRYAPDAVYFEMEKTNMTKVQRNNFEKQMKITRFILFNFNSLKKGEQEHLRALSGLTGINKKRLSLMLASCINEIDAVKIVSSAV